MHILCVFCIQPEKCANETSLYGEKIMTFLSSHSTAPRGQWKFLYICIKRIVWRKNNNEIHYLCALCASKWFEFCMQIIIP